MSGFRAIARSVTVPLVMPPRAQPAIAPLGGELAWGPDSVPLGMRDWASDTMKLLSAAEKNGEPDDPKKRSTWIQISKSGSWRGHSSGPFELGRPHFDSAIAELSKQQTPLAFDYEHASASCIPTHSPASGWSKELAVRGEPGAETLWAFTRLTKRAVAEIRDEEYSYISPTWMFDVPDRELGHALETDEDGEAIGGYEDGKTILACLHSVALTNVPFLDGMAPISLSLTGPLLAAWRSPDQRTASRLAAMARAVNVELARGRSFSAGRVRRLAEGTAMNDAELVAELYSITGTKTPEELIAWTKEKAGAGEEDAPPPPDGEADAKLRKENADLRTALELAQGSEKRLSDRLAPLEAEAVERDVTAVIAAGKAIEAERPALTKLRTSNPELFREQTAARGVVLPLSREVKPGTGTKAVKAGELEVRPGEERVVRELRAAGVSDEGIRKALEKRRENAS